MIVNDLGTLLLFFIIVIWAFGMVNPKSILRWGKRPNRKKLTSYAVILALISLVFTETGEDWLEKINGSAPTTGIQQQATRSVEKPEGELYVHFIDVGQGDATLLQGPDFTILIDAGKHSENDVVSYLESLGIKELDVVIGTHPHADHIGQMDKVMTTFDVQEVWMSGESHTTLTFERVLSAIREKGVPYHEPRAGETYEVGSAHIDILNPEKLTGDLHESSLAMLIHFGEVRFLFTGDAERVTELEMIKRGYPLDAQIFQLGHHGSSTSNTREFLEQVKPEVAIYSAEEGNSYGHPHREVLELLKKMNIHVYGTDQYGTIIVMTDGETYRIQTEKKGE